MADTLRIEHLSKTFTGQRALNDVSLSVAPGEVHALVGQNGSGKSTLIKIITGAHQPDAGVIRVAGREVSGLDPAAARRLGISKRTVDEHLRRGMKRLGEELRRRDLEGHFHP